MSEKLVASNQSMLKSQRCMSSCSSQSQFIPSHFLIKMYSSLVYIPPRTPHEKLARQAYFETVFDTAHLQLYLSGTFFFYLPPLPAS